MGYRALSSSDSRSASYFAETGVQTMQINTLFQLFSMVRGSATPIGIRQKLLMIPDLFRTFLCGEKTVRIYRSDNHPDVFVH